MFTNKSKFQRGHKEVIGKTLLIKKITSKQAQKGYYSDSQKTPICRGGKIKNLPTFFFI